MSKHNSKLVIRITVLGDKDTGKTSFIKTYLGDERQHEAQSVEKSGSAYNCDCYVDDTHIIQQILDSDGKHIAVTAWAHGVVVLYSVGNKDTFKLAEECITNIKEVTMRDAIIMLVANKVDSRRREISTEEGELLAAKFNCGYIELSALYDESDVSNVFYEMSQQILIRRGLKSTSMLKKSPQIFRRMMNAVSRKNRTLSTIREPPATLKETII